MKVNDKEFKKTVEGIANSIINSFTSQQDNFTHISTHLNNESVRKDIVKVSILLAKDIYSGVAKAQNSGKTDVTITQGGQYTANAKTLS
tara:strand:+ start:27920 stop:28186 length:267 start_codon:yes stop_codon:yes gene_type:complete